jgi:bleomycin hydrolase
MKLKKLFSIGFAAILSVSAIAQVNSGAASPMPDKINGYEFKDIKQLGTTPVKNQYKSGTCWVYSTNSFFESELMREGKGEVDLSEMYVSRGGYLDKGQNYVRRQGAASFGQGAENHDVLNIIAKYGIIPKSVYSGFAAGEDKPNHNEMEAVLKAMVEAFVKSADGKMLSPNWFKAYQGAVDGYFGTPPAEFEVNGKKYTPQTYFSSLKINLEDYVPLTSYTHHPFWKPFVLEVSDNYSNGNFYNIPIDDLMRVADNSVAKGFTFLWASDVSEKGFAAKEGLAVLPAAIWEDMTQGQKDSVFKTPQKERIATQEDRQKAFDELSTTDDHGMHITGSAKDQNGTTYYIVKNSWGTNIKKETAGYFYVSAPYFRYKTMSIMVHKDAIPKDILQKLRL